MKTGARPPPKDDPYLMDTKHAHWKYAGGVVFFFALAALLVEGPATWRLDSQEKELIEHRFDSGKAAGVLTEDRVRTIVKEEMKDVVKKDDLIPLFQHQMDDIRRLLPQQKVQPSSRKPPAPQ